MDAENAVDKAARELRRMIFDGELRASQPLRQEDLALRLGTSRHPVREALGRLSGEGLVVFRPKYGYTVRSLGPDEITEIFEMRMVLEEHAGFVATLKRDAQAVAEVAEVLRRMGDLKDRKSRNFRLWCAYNREFHARLFAASGRVQLCRTIGTLRGLDGDLHPCVGAGRRARPNPRRTPADLRSISRRRRHACGGALPPARSSLGAFADRAAAQPAGL